jgi:hypothetical protein
MRSRSMLAQNPKKVTAGTCACTAAMRTVITYSPALAGVPPQRTEPRFRYDSDDLILFA